MAETPADAVAPAVAGPGADASQFDLPSFMESDYGGAMHAGSFSPLHDTYTWEYISEEFNPPRFLKECVYVI